MRPIAHVVEQRFRQGCAAIADAVAGYRPHSAACGGLCLFIALPDEHQPVISNVQLLYLAGKDGPANRFLAAQRNAGHDPRLTVLRLDDEQVFGGDEVDIPPVRLNDVRLLDALYLDVGARMAGAASAAFALVARVGAPPFSAPSASSYSAPSGSLISIPNLS